MDEIRQVRGMRMGGRRKGRGREGNTRMQLRFVT